MCNFRTFRQKFSRIYSKTYLITPFKKLFLGDHTVNPPPPPPPRKCWAMYRRRNHQQGTMVAPYFLHCGRICYLK